MPLSFKFISAGEPGTLGAVCKLYFDGQNHEGCPFQRICCPDNLPVEEGAMIQIVKAVDADTLEAMAKAIRGTVKEVSREAVV
jgi:hypothetical protein